MPDITLGAAYKEEIPQGTVNDRGTGLDCCSIMHDIEGKDLKVTWKTSDRERLVHLHATESAITCKKLSPGSAVETHATKTYDDLMTDTSGNCGVADVSSWVEANFADLVS